MNTGNSDAEIRLVAPDMEVRFEWKRFDGDDNFADFQVVVSSSGTVDRFEFGDCVLRGLRKYLKFFADPSQTTAGSGFRYPDIRYLDVDRMSDGFQIKIRFEGGGLYREFDIQNPTIETRKPSMLSL